MKELTIGTVTTAQGLSRAHSCELREMGWVWWRLREREKERDRFRVLINRYLILITQLSTQLYKFFTKILLTT